MSALSRENLAALAYRAGWAAVRYIPQPLAGPLFDLGADVASGRGKSPAMEQLRRNLSRVVGPENVTRALVRDSMRSYMRYWQEAFRLPAIHNDPGLQERLRASVHGVEHFDASVDTGRGVVLALTHSGNWDMAGAFLAHHYGPFTTVAERLKPESLFDAFVEFRRSLGFNVIAHSRKPDGHGQDGDSHDAAENESPFEQLAAVLEDGGVVCLLAERDLSRSGVTVDFMGEPANIAAGPAALALRTGAHLHAVSLYFDGDGWGMEFSPEVEVTDVPETSQRLADHYAANIRQHPADWHMLQPQWNSDISAIAERRAARQAARAQAQSNRRGEGNE